MTSREAVIGIAMLIAGGAGTAALTKPAAAPAVPMPAPTPGPAKPAGPEGITRANRVEIMDATGAVAIVLYSEGGVPVLIVNDKGTARRLDLAYIAKRYGVP